MGVSKRKKRSILANWGVGIFYSAGGFKPGYPKPGRDRARGSFINGRSSSMRSRRLFHR